jgi:hypothetical protein
LTVFCAFKAGKTANTINRRQSLKRNPIVLQKIIGLLLTEKGIQNCFVDLRPDTTQGYL